MAKKSKPFHMHALTKASATHLRNAGHISDRKHKEIVADAEAGMKKTRPKPKMAPAAPMPQAPMPAMPSDNDGDEGY
jgi:hypothetical protein